MKVNVIRGGDTAFNAIVYPPPSNGLLDYLNNNISSAFQTVTNIPSQFMDNVHGMYNKFNSSSVINAGKAIMAKVGMHFNQYAIYTVPTEHLGIANLGMQEYILAQPELNGMYRDNLCNGYQATYFNPEPETYGTERASYRRVMDGILQFEEEDSYVMHYSQNDNMDELSTIEKNSILDTWDNVCWMLADRLDPTDPDGGGL